MPDLVAIRNSEEDSAISVDNNILNVRKVVHVAIEVNTGLHGRKIVSIDLVVDRHEGVVSINSTIEPEVSSAQELLALEHKICSKGNSVCVEGADTNQKTSIGGNHQRLRSRNLMLDPRNNCLLSGATSTHIGHYSRALISNKDSTVGVKNEVNSVDEVIAQHGGSLSASIYIQIQVVKITGVNEISHGIFRSAARHSLIIGNETTGDRSRCGL